MESGEAPRLSRALRFVKIKNLIAHGFILIQKILANRTSQHLLIVLRLERLQSVF